MNATVSKQEVREAYINSVVDKIVFLSNGWAKVPSSDGKHEYIVTVVHYDIPGRLADATDCGCFSCHRDNDERHFCKHREAVNRRIERDRAAVEQAEFKARVAEYAKQQEKAQEEMISEQVEEQHEPVRCGGCGCVLETSKNCTHNFCLWNSWYTEGLRLQEDERIKQEAKRQRELIAA